MSIEYLELHQATPLIRQVGLTKRRNLCIQCGMRVLRKKRKENDRQRRAVNEHDKDYINFWAHEEWKKIHKIHLEGRLSIALHSRTKVRCRKSYYAFWNENMSFFFLHISAIYGQQCCQKNIKIQKDAPVKE